MLAGALKDNGRAVIAGENTFGKGVIQTLVPLSDGSALAVTVRPGGGGWLFRGLSSACRQSVGRARQGQVKQVREGVGLGTAKELGCSQGKLFEPYGL